MFFQLTLNGYDSDNSETDDLIKWVKAPSMDVLMLFIEKNGLFLQEPPEELGNKNLDESEMDFVLDEKGIDKIARDLILTEIASEKLDIETLNSRNRDHLDFHELGVWAIKDALQLAYEAGLAGVRTIEEWQLFCEDEDEDERNDD